MRRLEQLVVPSLLVVHQIGCLPISRPGAMLFFQPMSRRNEHGSTALRSHEGFEGWGEGLIALGFQIAVPDAYLFVVGPLPRSGTWSISTTAFTPRVPSAHRTSRDRSLVSTQPPYLTSHALGESVGVVVGWHIGVGVVGAGKRRTTVDGAAPVDVVRAGHVRRQLLRRRVVTDDHPGPSGLNQ